MLKGLGHVQRDTRNLKQENERSINYEDVKNTAGTAKGI